MDSLFDKINSLQDLTLLIDNSSSVDGELINLEFKGSNGVGKLDKDIKKNLAKEICAFSNTYGGVLCFHFGEKTNLLGFSSRDLILLKGSVENWLSDCLEPKLLGLNLKVIDGIFIINIPESKTKPHRARTEEHYYYRQSTNSLRMPEIMVSSMYKSQDYLNTEVSVHLSKSSKQLLYMITIKNLSNIAGTKPRFIFQLNGHNEETIKFSNHRYLESLLNNSFYPLLNFKSKIPLIYNVSTDSDFANLVLYPKDEITLFYNSNQVIGNLEIEYVIATLDWMFLESVRQRKVLLIQMGKDKSKIIASNENQTEDQIVNLYHELIKN
jgi:hypothetical protein